MTQTQQIEHAASMRRHATALKQSAARGCLSVDPEIEAEKFILEGRTVNEFKRHCLDSWRQPQPLTGGDSGGSNRDFGSGNANTLGGMIVGHRSFQDVRQGGKKSVTMQFPHIGNLRAFTTADIGGTIQRAPGVVFANERLTVADLLAAGTMNSATIRYPREVSFTPAATTVSEGGTKPSQLFDVNPYDCPARKIAAVCQVADELVDDSPAAQSYINSRLAFAVLKEEDNQILNGNGTAPNMLGILNTSGLQTQAVGADTKLDAIRKAIGKIETNTDFIASGIVLHPTNWQALEMLKDANNNYFAGNVFVRTELGTTLRAPSLQGLPVSISKSIAAGTALVGAFNVAAQLFRRMGLMIEISNSDGDNFVKNLLTIRAELRAALAVYAPPAFVQVTRL